VQLLLNPVLDHVPSVPGLKGFGDKLIFERDEDHTLEGHGPDNLAGGGEAARNGPGDVKDDNVGAQFAGATERLGGVPRLSDDIQLILLQQPA